MYFLVLFLYYFVGDENGGAGPSLHGGAARGIMEMQCLRLQADRNGRGVRGARNGALSTDSQQKKSRSERREHPARSCPNVE